MIDRNEILDVAIEAAYEAGKITLAHFRTGSLEVETKADLSPVTIADRAAEERIAAIVARRFPTHAILGEEHGERGGTDPIRWIVDPIDGTRSFVAGVPLYGVLIGVEIEGEAEVGVVNIPALGDLYFAAHGGGAFVNGRRISVSRTKTIEDSVLLFIEPRKLLDDSQISAGVAALVRRARVVRGWGDCYGHMLVAEGRADIMLDPKMSVWDSAALKPIVEEAGGTFTDWSGAATIHGGSAISTNGALHADVLAALAAKSNELFTNR